jgi:hypothetical protein
MFLSSIQVDQFDIEYEKLRDDLLTRKSSDSDEIYNRKLELANTMEAANRVFQHFADTGKVELKALD